MNKLASLLAVVVVFPVSFTLSAEPAAKKSLPYTISKETTYLTGPLRKDGSVDYVAALNERYSRGVTPENNAAVPFWKAVGPKEIWPEYRDKYFRMLGIPPLPEKGDYFVDLEEYLTRHQNGAKHSVAKEEQAIRDEAWDLLKVASRRPWSPQEFPVLASWLKTNEKPLALLIEASKRPRRYDPLCCGSRTPLLAVLLPAAEHYRKISQALCVRAMLRLHENKVEEAWQDLLSCHRLARLAGQGPTVVDSLVAFSAEERACDGDQALLQYAQLSAAKLHECGKTSTGCRQCPGWPTSSTLRSDLRISDSCRNIFPGRGLPQWTKF